MRTIRVPTIKRMKLTHPATTLDERAASLTLIHIPGSAAANRDLFA
jgi:hypothetical protein